MQAASRFGLAISVALAGCGGDVCEDGDGDGAGIGAECRVVDCDDDNPDIHPGATEVPCNGVDEDCDGLEDDPADLDGDTRLCGDDPDDTDNTVCGVDADSDGCDDCAAGGPPDTGDDDADNDSVCANEDPDDADDTVCGVDADSDGCDDCGAGAGPNTASDDADRDTACVGDDPDDNDNTVCGLDADSDGCDDCVGGSGTPDTSSDDGDGDGVCADADSDDGNGTVCGFDVDSDGCDDCAHGGPPDTTADNQDGDVACADVDPDDNDIHVCGVDADADNCDDCSAGTGTPDTTTDEADGDTVCAAEDIDDGDPYRCRDVEADGCDDCSDAGRPEPTRDGPDFDQDGLCDSGDPDTDGDGDPDTADCAPFDPSRSNLADEIGCNGVDENCNGFADDGTVDADGDTVSCATDTDDLDPTQCGRDTDSDGCDDCAAGAGPNVSTDDGDDDTVCASEDLDDSAATVCGLDADQDGCDDCAGGSGPDPAADGPDNDSDGICNSGDSQPSNVNVCGQDLDADGCDDCGGGGGPNTATDGIDSDGDGVCNVTDNHDTEPTVCDLDLDDDGCDDCAAGNGPSVTTDDADLDGSCADVDCDDGDPTVFPGAPELPADGVAQDCGGSDLVPSDASGIFIAADRGADAPTCGTQASPCQTLLYGVNRAEAGPQDAVFVAAGVYATLTETTSVSIFGGYESTGWARDLESNATIVRGNTPRLLAPGTGVAVAFEGLTLERSEPFSGPELMAGVTVSGATVTMARNVIRAGDNISADGNCFAMYVVSNDAPVTLVDNNIRCGLAARYSRGIYILDSTVSACGNVIVGGGGRAGAASAAGVLVAGDSARVRLVNNFVVGGVGPVVHGVHIAAAASVSDYVFLAHNVIAGGFNYKSSASIGVYLDQSAYAVMVNNVIDGGHGDSSYGLVLATNLPSDDRRVVLIHNDIWSVSQTAPVATELETWSLADVNACVWEDCLESSGNVSVDPLLIDPYGYDPHVRAGSPVVDRGTDASPWYAGAALCVDVDGEARSSPPDLGADEL